MWDGWLSLGGVGIGNRGRAYGYATTADCPAMWLDDPECDALADALGESEYVFGNIADAPWFDPDDPDLSSRFLGSYIASVDGLRDSTRVAEVTERSGNGGRIGGRRAATRPIRVRAWLTAAGADALDYGMSWLAAAVQAGACGQHESRCGVADLAFFTACPPARDEGEPDADYQARVDKLRRFVHDVDVTSAPFTVQERESQDGVHIGRLVEFTLTAEDAFVYTPARNVPILPSTPIVVQDTLYNLVGQPSAELDQGTTVVATNYATNPSVESNATGWVAQTSSGITPSATGARSTELAAVGAASYKVSVVTTNSGTTNQYVRAYQNVDISGIPAGARVSVNVWGTFALLAGTATLTEVRGYVQWLNSSGTVLPGTTNLGAVSPSGGAIAMSSILPPVGAVTAQVIVSGNLSAWSAGASLALYADALAVTVP